MTFDLKSDSSHLENISRRNLLNKAELEWIFTFSPWEIHDCQNQAGVYLHLGEDPHLCLHRNSTGAILRIRGHSISKR